MEELAILCRCDAVEKATRYRWRMRLAGAPEYVLATSTTGLLAQVGNVALGQTVEIIVQAVNERRGGDHSASGARGARDSIEWCGGNGVLAAAKTTLQNGNGNGNGASQPRLIPA